MNGSRWVRSPLCAALALALPLPFASGCLDTGSEALTFPLRVGGSGTNSITDRSGFEIELQQARLVIGPLYLCSSPGGGELCELARAEWQDSVDVDLLSSEDSLAGDVLGHAGTIRSYMFDLGYSSLLTRSETLPSPAAEKLRGSLRLAGTARRDAVVVSFAGTLALQAGEQTEKGVALLRGRLETPVDLDEVSSMRIQFDLADWFSTLRFEDIASADGCTTACTVEAPLENGSELGRMLTSTILGGQRPEVTFKRKP